MNQMHHILLITLALDLFAQCCTALHDPDMLRNYLDAPSPAEFDEPHQRDVRQACLDLQIHHDSNPELVMEKVRRLAESDDNYKDIYKNMLMLVDHDDNSTDNLEPLIDLLKSIKAQAEHSHQVGIKNCAQFVQHFDVDKFLKWAPLVEASFPEEQTVNVVNSFDSVFKEALEAEKKISTRPPGEFWVLYELGEILKDFDMTSGDLDTPRMLEALNGDKFCLLHSIEECLKPIQAFLDDNCNKLQDYKPQLDIINMARANSGLYIRNHNLRRMSDYYRICLAWKRPETHDKILANIRRHMYATGLSAKIASCSSYLDCIWLLYDQSKSTAKMIWTKPLLTHINKLMQSSQPIS